MKTWIVEPRDTLVVRDGRPVMEGAPPMRSLDFPWPSTIAGLVRTRIGTDERGNFTKLTSAAAREISVQGPWLAKLDEAGRIIEHVVPAPQDCLWSELDPVNHIPQLARRRLVPIDLPAGCMTDLDTSYQLVGDSSEAPRSKGGGGPAFWRWNDLQDWLLAPEPLAHLCGDFGYDAPTHERRVHVVVDATTQTAIDSQLFSTDGLRFSTKPRERRGVEFRCPGKGPRCNHPPHLRRERLGLVFRCGDERLREGQAVAGGERRISFLRQAQGPALPELPAALDLGKSRLARVVLLTPAIFEGGFAPRAFGEGTKVVGAVVRRQEIISGWDFELERDADGKLKQRGPKPTRRMAPAGSVYWVRLEQNVDTRKWAKGIWMKSVSDHPQDRCDGFGLAVVGVG
jgi:CRISPR-associated protein Cmr3